LTSWEERIEYLGQPFSEQRDHGQTDGEHEFDRDVQTLVVKALPPYQLASESISLIPSPLQIAMFRTNSPKYRPEYTGT
jgi:hypothetical protein